jgi:3-phenylpropionate/trans-cinnamate dioxygenase ferredoxin reductase subunit
MSEAPSAVRVAVVGNGVGGFACAAALADAGLAPVLIGPGLPHDRPPLSKRGLATGRVPVLATGDTLRERGIRHLDGHVTAHDLAAHRLEVTLREADEPRVLEAETIVWATGFEYPRPPVPGLEDAHVNATGAGMLGLAAALAEEGRRVLVVGAGLIGSETAATLAARHAVTLVDMLARPLERFGPDVATRAEEVFARLGVTFVGSCSIAAARRANGITMVETASDGTLAADVVIAAAGVRATVPAELANASRPPAIDVDEHLRVPGLDGVYAIGDAVSFPHPRYGRIAIPHWDHARASGVHVAATIGGARAPYARDPYWFSDIGPLRLQQVGHAGSVVEWEDRGEGLRLGLGADGLPCSALLVNAPTRLKEARALVAAP